MKHTLMERIGGSVVAIAAAIVLVAPMLVWLHRAFKL